ncbi:MAG: glycosyltransferase family 2 protein [Thermohalobaculum sp.]|nr:glycosyltransferase family 2 protein [Thermohalobaculum sp.]
MLSVVVPCFNEAEVFPETVRRILDACRGLGREFEVIFVDDGSTDATWTLIAAARADDPRIKGVKLARNHGHQLALTAGLAAASGDPILMLDADLQDPPELLPDMLALMERGYDVVYGKRRSRRGETWFKLASASAFYRLLGRLSDVEIPADTGDFRLVSRKVLDEFLKMPERNRFVRGMFAWLGHRQIGLEYDRDERAAGTTKYPLRAMLRFATDAFTSFSALPLKIASTMAFGSFIVTAAVGLYVAWSLIFLSTVPGWASLLLILSFFAGIQLLTLGIMGEYVGRIYTEVKGRPVFVIDRHLGIGSPDETDG